MLHCGNGFGATVIIVSKGVNGTKSGNNGPTAGISLQCV